MPRKVINPNHNKVILDLCGGTGAWSAPYKRNGYTVIKVTLPKMDVLTYSPPENVYGILAAPPCTEFSVAKTSTPRNYKLGMETVYACLRIIWKARYTSQYKIFWALENPVGHLRQFLGKPPFTFQPWEFGDFHTKKTDIWGYFNFPTKTVKEKPKGLNKKFIKGSNSLQSTGASYNQYKYLFNAQTRAAITPPGFANAFYKANK
jgi:hypothetical protein